MVHSLARLQRELDEALAKKQKADESQQLPLSRTEGGGLQWKVEGPLCWLRSSPLRLQSELESALASKHKADENEQLQLGRRHEMNMADSACVFMSCVSVLPPLRLHSELQSAIASKQEAEHQQLDSATSRCHYGRLFVLLHSFSGFSASWMQPLPTSKKQMTVDSCRSDALAGCCTLHDPCAMAPLYVGLLPFSGCGASWSQP